MNSQDTVRGWLQEISTVADGNPLTLDENGQGTFQYSNDVQLTISVPENSDLLQLLIPLIAPPEQDRAAFFQDLLERNYLLLETDGATFALDKNSGEVVLCYSQPVGSLDAASFRNLVGNFLESGEKWLNRFASAELKEAEIGTTPDSSGAGIRI